MKEGFDPAERIDLLKLAVRLKCCILFDWSVMLEHRNFFFFFTGEHVLLQLSVWGETADQEHSPSLSTALDENRTQQRWGLWVPLWFFDRLWRAAGPSSVDLCGGLVKRRQLLPPVVFEKRAVDFPSGVSLWSLRVGGGGYPLVQISRNSDGIKTDKNEQF